MNAGTDAGAIPAQVLVTARLMVTAAAAVMAEEAEDGFGEHGISQRRSGDLASHDGGRRWRPG
jgi:hypothetical protein